jgi:2-keto-4-pentenoate hydratase/2-oxohepta-3-ene-1,7-dioic acid hydratase in catechol pathway
MALTQPVTKYVRFAQGSAQSFGILDGESIRELRGDMFGSHQPTGRLLRLSDITLLPPVNPGKVIAVGLNYQSHLGERPPASYPGLFAKYPSSIIPTGAEIVLPADSRNAHFEGEMVVVIGKTAKNVTRAQARSHIFGVTAGNDVSERDWQRADLQWFRAKASDTFGPLGPAIVTGLNFDDLLLQTRVNGQVVQSQRTKDLIFDVAGVVSYVSQYVTLLPGDVIYTGTPGTTRPIKAGDVVEIELEGVGILRNPVTQSSTSGEMITPAGEAKPLAFGGFPMHSLDRPQPPVVKPGPAGPPVPPPSDAVVLFDGRSLDNWRSTDSLGSAARWKVVDGYMEVARGTGSIQTKQGFGDAHLHVEWASPAPATGTGQNRGNSGVFLMTSYEVQVLDSYQNSTYPDGQAGAIYGQFPPLVNASRPPGEWQTYDIFFRAPRFDARGQVTTPARMTVIHNGILVQDNVSLLGPTSNQRRDPYVAHPDRMPISLQDHGDPVRFRNIWVRDLK